MWEGPGGLGGGDGEPVKAVRTKGRVQRGDRPTGVRKSVLLLFPKVTLEVQKTVLKMSQLFLAVFEIVEPQISRIWLTVTCKAKHNSTANQRDTDNVSTWLVVSRSGSQTDCPSISWGTPWVRQPKLLSVQSIYCEEGWCGGLHLLLGCFYHPTLTPRQPALPLTKRKSISRKSVSPKLSVNLPPPPPPNHTTTKNFATK